MLLENEKQLAEASGHNAKKMYIIAWKRHWKTLDDSPHDGILRGCVLRRELYISGRKLAGRKKGSACTNTYLDPCSAENAASSLYYV